MNHCPSYFVVGMPKDEQMQRDGLPALEKQIAGHAVVVRGGFDHPGIPVRIAKGVASLPDQKQLGTRVGSDFARVFHDVADVEVRYDCEQCGTDGCHTAGPCSTCRQPRCLCLTTTGGPIWPK